MRGGGRLAILTLLTWRQTNEPSHPSGIILACSGIYRHDLKAQVLANRCRHPTPAPKRRYRGNNNHWNCHSSPLHPVPPFRPWQLFPPTPLVDPAPPPQSLSHLGGFHQLWQLLVSRLKQRETLRVEGEGFRSSGGGFAGGEGVQDSDHQGEAPRGGAIAVSSPQGGKRPSEGSLAGWKTVPDGRYSGTCHM